MHMKIVVKFLLATKKLTMLWISYTQMSKALLNKETYVWNKIIMTPKMKMNCDSYFTSNNINANRNITRLMRIC